MSDRRVLFLFLVPWLLVGPAAHAGDDDKGRNGARRAFEQGKALPLSDVLGQLQPQLGGQVIEAELDIKGGVYVYELKVLTASGRSKVRVDAATGKVIDPKQTR